MHSFFLAQERRTFLWINCIYYSGFGVVTSVSILNCTKIEEALNSVMFTLSEKKCVLNIFPEEMAYYYDYCYICVSMIENYREMPVVASKVSLLTFQATDPLGNKQTIGFHNLYDYDNRRSCGAKNSIAISRWAKLARAESVIMFPICGISRVVYY